jgi:hypothetical protein
MALAAWLSFGFLLALMPGSVLVLAVLDLSHRVRGYDSAVTRADFLAKYRFLGLLATQGSATFVIAFFVPAAYSAPHTLWRLTGFPVAILFLVLCPRPKPPPVRMPTVPKPSLRGQGIVLTRQIEAVPPVALPILIDDERAGTIRAGETQPYDLEPGVHSLQIKKHPGAPEFPDSHANLPQVVLIQPGKWSGLECGTRQNTRGFLRRYHPEQRAWVRPASTPLPPNTRPA